LWPRIALLFCLAAGVAGAGDQDPPTAIERARQAWQAGDYQEARRLFLPLAADGVAEALFRLGMIYEQGLGVVADPDLAEQFYSGYCPLPPQQPL
jgi:TPR repeat protein